MKIFKDFNNWKTRYILNEMCIDLNSCDRESLIIFKEIIQKYKLNEKFVKYSIFVDYMLNNNYIDELKNINKTLFMSNVINSFDDYIEKIGMSKYTKVCDYTELFLKNNTTINNSAYGYLKQFCDIFKYNYNTVLIAAKILENRYPQLITRLYANYNGRFLNVDGFDFYKHICETILFTTDYEDTNSFNSQYAEKEYTTTSDIVAFANKNYNLPLFVLLEKISKKFQFLYRLSFFNEIYDYMFENTSKKQLKMEFSDLINDNGNLTIKGTTFIFVVLLTTDYDGFDRTYVFNNSKEKEEVEKLKNKEKKSILDIMFLTEKILDGGL